jgi:hypothetical protein
VYLKETPRRELIRHRYCDDHGGTIYQVLVMILVHWTGTLADASLRYGIDGNPPSSLACLRPQRSAISNANCRIKGCM